MGSHYSCDPPEKRAKKRRYAIFCPKGQNCSAWRCIVSCAAQGSVSKGAILFHKREWPPLDPPREGFRLTVWGLNHLFPSGMGMPARGFAALGVAIRFDSLLLSAVAQPLAALLPYGCGTPLAGAALESERKCSVITCYRWHNIAASAAKPPRQAVCRPMRRHTRLTIVRRGCKTVTKRTDSWRSHVHRT